MSTTPVDSLMITTHRAARTIARDLIDHATSNEVNLLTLMISPAEGDQPLVGMQTNCLEGLYPELMATGREKGKDLDAIRKVGQDPQLLDAAGMTRLEAAARYAALYTPRVDDLIMPLRDAGNSLSVTLEALAHAPNPDRVERVLMHLEGIRRHLILLHSVLTRAEDLSDGR